MRLFTKIFFSGTFVFSLAFLVSGYVLIQYSMETAMKREADFALKQYQYDKFTVQSGLLADTGGFSDETRRGEEIEKLFQSLAEKIDSPAAFFSEDGILLYSEIEGMNRLSMETVAKEQSRKLEDGRGTYFNGYQFQQEEGRHYILTYGLLSCGTNTAFLQALGGKTDKIFLATRSDISSAVKQQQTILQYFKSCYGIVMAAGMGLLLLLSVFLTQPLKRMTKAADRMAGGYYKERMDVSGRDEIGDLARSLNQMAGAVEEKMEELSKAARQKEDFVANFAHELKTPLTSVIGYADMLYQKELPREEARKASWYIWNEGMRLEALSLKLMDLIVLEKQDFSLQEMPADELLQDIADSLYPLLMEKQVVLSMQAEPAYIKVEYDLFKTLLLNLVDNSLKAGCSSLELSGTCGKDSYRICVKDDGRGIPEEELAHITEAFYMVDKSRSRKQHGAGLGLALADKIAGIHGFCLQFESRKEAGTSVSFCLPCKQEDWDEE